MPLADPISVLEVESLYRKPIAANDCLRRAQEGRQRLQEDKVRVDQRQNGLRHLLRPLRSSGEPTRHEKKRLSREGATFAPETACAHERSLEN